MSDNIKDTVHDINEPVKAQEFVFQELSAEKLLLKANTLPKNPGCYLMRNKKDEIIYVGKAKNLRSRVQSYFNKSTKTIKTQYLVSHVKNFSFIITENEAESYILENNLIKKHKPKYNIRLKDDKSYPYLSVNFNEDFPRLEYVRRPKHQKGVELFGPFPTGSNISSVLRILTKAFRLRDCSIYEFRSRKTPCILYQMNQCSAPCVGFISKEDYRKDVEGSLDFFRGAKKAKASLESLKKKMSDYAHNEEFEKAAGLRDMIFILEKFLEDSYKQTVELNEEKNVDIISFYKGAEELDIALYIIRHGNLMGNKNFNFSNLDSGAEIEEDIIAFLTQYYSQSENLLPDIIVADFKPDLISIFSEIMTKISTQKKIKVMGETKKYKELLNSTRKHAEESQRVRALNADSVYVGLNKLKDLLKLKARPRVLECYDIAIWQGKSPTASQIVFHDGAPDKKSYKYYNLEERPEGNNDFAMMREVFERRLKHGKLPDVFIVDGGKQQVNTVLKVLEEFKVEVPVVGIAKARDLTKGNLYSKEISRSDERLVIPGRANPFILSRSFSLFKIIVQMRDEAHRFSRRLHHKKEKERTLHSWLDEVPGMTDLNRRKIQSYLTMDREELSSWNAKTIQDYFGIKEKLAKSIYEYLRANNDY